MSDFDYVMDPEGVILTLHNPNAPFCAFSWLNMRVNNARAEDDKRIPSGFFSRHTI